MKNVSEITHNLTIQPEDSSNRERASAGEDFTATLNRLFSLISASCRWAYSKLKSDDVYRTTVKKLWGEALLEAGITTMQQMAGGVAKIKSKEIEDIPDVNDFIEWCSYPDRSDWPSLDKLIKQMDSYQRYKKDPNYYIQRYGKAFKFSEVVMEMNDFRVDWSIVNFTPLTRERDAIIDEAYSELKNSNWKLGDYNLRIEKQDEKTIKERARKEEVKQLDSRTKEELQRDKQKSKQAMSKALADLKI